MSKNPFELRFDILKLTQEYFLETVDLNQKFILQNAEAAFKAGKITFDEFVKLVPAKFTVDDMLKEAQKLYDFVKTNK